MKSSIYLENGLLLAEMKSKWFSPNKEQAIKITGRGAKDLEAYSLNAFSEIKKALDNSVEEEE